MGNRWIFHVTAVLSLVIAQLAPIGARANNVSDAAAPAALAWQAGGPLPETAGDGALFVLGSKLYYAGGRTAASSQPQRAVYATDLSPLDAPGAWKSVGEFPAPARFSAAVVTTDSRTYLLGGSSGALLDRVDSFDGTAWRSNEAPLPNPLNLPAAAAVGQRIYVVGGIATTGTTNAVWSSALGADGTLGSWRSEAALPTALTTRLAVQGACLYAVGGKDATGQRHAEVYRAVLAGDQLIGWTQTMALPQPLALHDVAVRDGMLYVLGGEKADGTYSNQVYAATIAADCSLGSWTADTLPNGQARRRLSVAAAELGLYLAGGQVSSGAYTNDTWYHLLPPKVTPTPTNTATFTATSTATLTATATPTPTSTPGVQAELRSSSNGVAEPGDEITYSVDYRAVGSGILTNVVITNAIPSGALLIPDSITPKESGSVTRGIVTWNVGTLGLGVTAGTVSYRVRIPTPTASPTPTRAHTPTDTATATRTATPTHTPVGAPTDTPTTPLTITRTPTPTPTITRTYTPTDTPTSTLTPGGPTPTSTATPGGTCGEITGYLFFDANGNGARDLAETTGLGGVSVRLKQAGAPVSQTTPAARAGIASAASPPARTRSKRRSPQATPTPRRSPAPPR